VKRKRGFRASEKHEFLDIFKEFDVKLEAKRQRLEVTVVGGASLILLGVRERVTIDIDIANRGGADLFCELCKEREIPVDRITVASTVDLIHCPTIEVFKGYSLTVLSVTPNDLIKLKLERFRKQDPEDIYAIIGHYSVSFDAFLHLVLEMLPDFIGNVREVALSAQIVVEQVYPQHIAEFKAAMEKRLSLPVLHQP